MALWATPRMKGTRLTEEMCVIENCDHEEKVAELINGGKHPVRKVVRPT